MNWNWNSRKIHDEIYDSSHTSHSRRSDGSENEARAVGAVLRTGESSLLDSFEKKRPEAREECGKEFNCNKNDNFGNDFEDLSMRRKDSAWINGGGSRNILMLNTTEDVLLSSCNNNNSDNRSQLANRTNLIRHSSTISQQQHYPDPTVTNLLFDLERSPSISSSSAAPGVTSGSVQNHTYQPLLHSYSSQRQTTTTMLQDSFEQLANSPGGGGGAAALPNSQTSSINEENFFDHFYRGIKAFDRSLED